MKTKMLSEYDSDQIQVSTGTLSMISRLLFPASLVKFEESEKDVDFRKKVNKESQSDLD